MNITNQHLLKNNSLKDKQFTKDGLGEGKLIEGDTLNVLKKIDDDVVNVGVTSPPYNKQEKQKGVARKKCSLRYLQGCCA